VRHLKADLATLAITVVVLALLGVAAGFAWSAVAPVTQYARTEIGLQVADPESQSLIAADGWFAVITGGLGLVTGVVAYLLAWRRSIGALAGLTAGGLLGAFIAFLVGRSSEGTFQLGLTAYGVLLAWPFFATGIFWAIEFVLSYRDRRAAPVPPA
jgi:hypothetical protein